MKRFRYPGVRPFEAADRALFFGRDRDIADLYELVRAEPLVVLFGKSGYGKSSLLNAGMLPLFGTPEVRSGGDEVPSESTPEVRSGAPPSPERTSGVQESDDWIVLETRFGEYTEGLSDTPLERLRQRLLEKLPTSTTQTRTPQTLPNSLWLDFKSRLSPQNRRFLLVFDQFEEFFSYPPEQQAAFKDQLADLLYEEMPQAIRAAARSLERAERRALAARMEVKALFAIRSDRMSDLDRLKDRLPAILHKRYKLSPLNREQAQEAIVRPAMLTSEEFESPPFRYQSEALQIIINELSHSNAGADKSGGIESFQLQILCDDIDSRVANGLVPDHDGNNLPDISVEDLPDFSEVFVRYYERRLELLPENQRTAARLVIEDGLVRYDAVRDEGRRLSVDGQTLLEDFELAGLTPSLLRELENTFLVRREPNTLGGYSYELSHDTLLAPVIIAKKKRIEEAERERLIREQEQQYKERERLRQEREQRNRARRNSIIGICALLLLSFALWQTYLAQQAKSDANKAYQAAAEQERKAHEATRRAQAAGEEAQNARRIAELATKNALTAQEKAELERRKVDLFRQKFRDEQSIAEKRLQLNQIFTTNRLPENFDILTPLDSLNCSNWNLSSVSSEIGKLQNLRSLNLAGNQLTSLPAEIGSLTNLQSLNLGFNALTSLPREIGDMPKLQLLDLARNQLTNLPEEIGKLTNLRSLNLIGNRFSSLPREIGNLKNLQLLDLTTNQVTNLPEEIGNLIYLQGLDLRNNGLMALPEKIWNLQNLQSLDLNSNQLTNLSEAIGKLENLQELYLGDNQLTSLPIEALKQLKKLKKLILKDRYGSNPLPASEVEALRQAMPWCEVVWEE